MNQLNLNQIKYQSIGKQNFHLEVQCPKCGGTQKMITSEPIKATRKCVFCERSFKVHNGPNSSTIRRQI